MATCCARTTIGDSGNRDFSALDQQTNPRARKRHSAKVYQKSAIARVAVCTLPSAGPRGKESDCRRWRQIWLITFASSALAAKAATKTIPIVFTYASDPVKAGIVASLNRPEENITGVTWFGGDLVGKRLALLHDVVPNISNIGFLMGAGDPDESSQR